MSDELTLFGTDGFRGEANVIVTAEMAAKIGTAVGGWLQQEGRPLRAIIGRDTRRSGPMIEAALTAGLAQMGVETISIGVAPTPAVSFLCPYYEAGVGIIVSASHNKATDNGIKLIGPDGCKLPTQTEQTIEQTVKDELRGLKLATSDKIGQWKDGSAWVESYADYLVGAAQEIAGAERPFEGMRLALDCANGAAYAIAPRVLRALGAALCETGIEPNGDNINENCGSTHLGGLIASVTGSGAHAGIAFDGDADRCLLIDERGNEVDGDRIMCWFALHKQRNGGFKPPVVVATIMSNGGMRERLAGSDIQLVMTDVGDRHVVNKMREMGAIIGGEQSGHLIFAEHSVTGDGILTAIQALCLLKESGKPLSEVAHPFRPMPQKLEKYATDRTKVWHEDAAITEAYQQAQQALAPKGRVNIRESGTERGIVRVLVEAEEAQVATEWSDKIGRIIIDRIGA